LILVGLVVLFRRDPATPESRGPFEYDISQYEAVPEGMMKWREVEADAVAVDGIPYALATSAGNIVVAVDNRLIRYPERRTLATLTEPARAMAFHEDGRLFVGLNRRVEVYDAAGKRLSDWTTLGEKAQITSMAFFDGKLFVCDAGNLCEWRFSSEGTLERQFTGPKGVFVVPSPYFDVASSEEGLWIVNPGIHRIGLYDVDFKLKRTIGKTGMGPAEFSGCCNPSHLAVAKDGSLVALEKGLPRVRVFEPTGELREFVASAKSISSSYPVADVSVDSLGRVLVLDRVKKAVRVFVNDAGTKSESEHE